MQTENHTKADAGTAASGWPWWGRAIAIATPIVAFLVVAFVVGEILAQASLRRSGYFEILTRSRGLYDHLQALWERDVPGYRYLPKPNVRDELGGIRYDTNSLGLRDDEVAVPKPANVYRVLMLGDSVVFGFMVERSATMADVLEQRLNAVRFAGDRRCEVINAGVEGYGIEDERRLYEARLADLGPDLVILGICLNDVNTPFDITKGRGFARGPVPDRAKVWGSRLLYFLRMWRKGMRRRLKGQPVCYRHLNDAAYWDEYEKRFVELLSSVRGRGIPLAAVTFPESFQMTNDTTDWMQQRVVELCAGHGVECQNVLEEFRAIQPEHKLFPAPGEGYFWPRDTIHTLAPGHRVCADALFEWMQANRQQLVGPRPASGPTSRP